MKHAFVVVLDFNARDSSYLTPRDIEKELRKTLKNSFSVVVKADNGDDVELAPIGAKVISIGEQ